MTTSLAFKYQGVDRTNTWDEYINEIANVELQNKIMKFKRKSRAALISVITINQVHAGNWYHSLETLYSRLVRIIDIDETSNV